MALSSYVMAGGLLLMLATAWQAMQCELHLYRGGDVRPMACPCSIADDVLTPLVDAADRESLRVTQQEFEGVPLPLLLQLVAAAAASLLGGLQAWGTFKPIALADNPRQGRPPGNPPVDRRLRPCATPAHPACRAERPVAPPDPARRAGRRCSGPSAPTSSPSATGARCWRRWLGTKTWPPCPALADVQRSKPGGRPAPAVPRVAAL